MGSSQPQEIQGPAASSRAPRQRRREAGGFRGDVEGLRAVAVGSVLLYHADVASVPGGYVGVDVFFVISGFLITGLLVRELERSGTVSLRRFYARRARRLLPATVVVLLAVVLLAWLLPPVDRRSAFADVIGAGVYMTNWQQASQAVDYSALGAAASPVQHFWSLAVEEQFYLVWPLVLLAVAWWCRIRGGRDVRPRLAVVLGTIAVVSFAYAVSLTFREGGAAYFSTFTRGWELAVGGLLALVPASRWSWPARLPGVVAGAGIAGIVSAVLWFTDDTRFPGPGALLPVLGTAAVIAAGAASTDTAVARLLSRGPVRYVGRISYSWYLWHWPAIVFTTAWLGGLPSALMLAVVTLSWVPAALTHRLVEERFRTARAFHSNRHALQLGAVCTSVTVLAGTVSWANVPTVVLATPEQAKGAKALLDSRAMQKSAKVLRPVPEQATEARGKAYRDGCLVDQRGTTSGKCVYGDEDADTAVVLFGDSHAMQYASALIPIARERGWRLVVLTKSSCGPADVTTYNTQLKRAYDECDVWRDNAIDRIEREDPAMVITGNQAVKTVMRDGHRLGSRSGAQTHQQGYVSTLRTLRQKTDAELVTLADNAYPPQEIPSCVSGALDDLTECAFPENEGFDYEDVNAQATGEVDGAELIDPTPMLCQNGTCPAVIGNVLVYRNSAHITSTYMYTLRHWLDDRLPDDV